MNYSQEKLVETLSAGNRLDNFHRPSFIGLSLFGKPVSMLGADIVRPISLINSLRRLKIEVEMINYHQIYRKSTISLISFIAIIDREIIIDVHRKDGGERFYMNIIFPIGENKNSTLLKLKKMLPDYEYKRQPSPGHIHLMCQSPERGLYLKQFYLHQSQLDLNLHYNEGIIGFHDQILERLEKDKDKGIIFLHGKPGTGKTTYIRHLISLLNKKVIIVPGDMVHSLASPVFMEFMLDQANAVMVIEDAENVIERRQNLRSSAVSNLLNLSDGILSDCLNIQFICTFNVDICNVDKAFFRGGRMIGSWEFTPLNAEKASALVQMNNIQKEVRGEMTLAEIFYEFDNTSVVGLNGKTRSIGY